MIPASELILNPDQSVYHLKLKPTDIATKVLLVGDPDRVDRVAAHFDSIEMRQQKREFRTVTGLYQGERMTVISTGIGTDNIDIVLNELDVLWNIDCEKREIRAEKTRAKLLRLGTCGGVQANVAVGTMVCSSYAVGLDGLMHFYEYADSLSEAGRKFDEEIRAYFAENSKVRMPAYGAEVGEGLIEWVEQAFPQIEVGITMTAAGFYGPQGRSLGRVASKETRLIDLFADYSFEGNRMLNFEMENSAVLGLGRALGHDSGSICVILANRAKGRFHEKPKKAVEDLIQTGLAVMKGWN